MAVADYKGYQSLRPLHAEVAATPRHGGATATGPDLDFVRFLSKQFLAEEASQKAELYVMRTGSLEGSCVVHYRTENLTALAGDKYEETSGWVVFESGETLKRIEVKLFDDDNFDTTLEFRVVLEHPEGCELEPDLHGGSCTVLILDDDIFPSNDVEEVREGKSEVLNKISARLLMQYAIFTYRRVPDIWWKSIFVLGLGQLHNAYYLMTIYIRVYLVDVVLNVKVEPAELNLLVPGSRYQTVLCLAALYVLPNIFLSCIDFMEVGPLCMSNGIRKHHSINIFRKYMNYTKASQADVPVQDMASAMLHDIPDLAQKGYMVLFDLAGGTGKILCVAFFVISKNPQNVIPIIIYPLIMGVFLGMRKSKYVYLSQAVLNASNETEYTLVEAIKNFQLFTNYKERTFAVKKFEQVMNEKREINSLYRKFHFWNAHLLPWITLMSVGTYMMLGALQVEDGAISLGAYLATLNVYKDLGDRFEGIYHSLETLIESVSPLIKITQLLNKPTDTTDRLKQAVARTAFLDDHMKRQAQAKKVEVPETELNGLSEMNAYDLVPIVFEDVSIEEIPHLSGITTEIALGQLVLIKGAHGYGKRLLLEVVTNDRTPTRGRLLMSPHLSLICVGASAEILTNLNLYENLTFGTPKADPARVRRIVCRMGFKDSGVVLKTLDAEMVDPDSDKRLDYHAQSLFDGMSLSELKRIHMARAFINNPEVLVLHRPFDEADDTLRDLLLSLLREFVQERGVELDPARRARRPVHTAFFTCGDNQHVEYARKSADMVWSLEEQTKGGSFSFMEGSPRRPSVREGSPRRPSSPHVVLGSAGGPGGAATPLLSSPSAVI